MEESIELYRYPWTHLSDCILRTKTSVKTTKTYDFGLSRASIYDSDLVKKSEKQTVEDSDWVLDRHSRLLSKMNVAQAEEIEEKTIIEEDSVDIESQLPAHFGKKSDFSMKKKNRKMRSRSDWLKKTDFDSYWEESNSLLVYKTWLADFGHVMEENGRVELRKQISDFEDSLNGYLIDEHMSIDKNEDYSNVVSKSSRSSENDSFEDKYALHVELIKKQAEIDFDKYKAEYSRHRCKTFFEKVKRMGFVPGFNDETSSSSSSTSNLISQNTYKMSIDNSDNIMKKKLKRSAIIYGDDEVFSDISYAISDQYTSLKPFVDNSKLDNVEVNNMTSSVGIVESSNKKSSQEEDFVFDPDKEPYLIASKAHKYYKEDAEIRKYWFQRYRLFTKLDEGIIMDREGWFSVTPERIAEHIADRIVVSHGMIVVDAFAGVGGNSIQFAKKGARVIAIDMDPIRLKCAKQNAKVYGVDHLIEFICCDFFHFAAKYMNKDEKSIAYPVDAVFLSPPWGGPSYLNSKEFDLNDLTPNGYDIYEASKALSPNIAYFLPRNTIMKQLIALAGDGQRCEIEQSCLNKKVKTLTVYYGNLAVPNVSQSS